ncbi:hypothetical protein AB1N83_010332 [Pleurotus pulmonarius]
MSPKSQPNNLKPTHAAPMNFLRIFQDFPKYWKARHPNTPRFVSRDKRAFEDSGRAAALEIGLNFRIAARSMNGP